MAHGGPSVSQGTSPCLKSRVVLGELLTESHRHIFSACSWMPRHGHAVMTPPVRCSPIFDSNK